jgi:cell division GTPase FtsZ
VNARSRAIEIAAVGLGQGGGNIAAELYRRGYAAIALNTATSDLTSLASGASKLPAELCFYIGVEGYDGAGGDAGYGRECIRRHAAAIRQRVELLAQNMDLVLICAGLGGGTGSAVPELLAELAELDLPVVVLATLPTDHESAIAKVNAVRAINEMVAQPVLGFMFVDNARLAKDHGGVSFDRYYAEINRLITEPLDALNRLNARDDLLPIRTLDGEDFRRLMLSSGILSFSVTKLPRLSAEALLEAVTEGLLRSSMHPDGYQLENITYLGLVIEAPESVLANAPFAMFEWLSEQIKTETQGAAIYVGIYKSSAQDAQATLRVFASSQALPDGVQSVVEQATREGGQLQEKLQRNVAGLQLGDLEELDLFRSNPGRRRGLQRQVNGIAQVARAAPLPPPPRAAAVPPVLPSLRNVPPAPPPALAPRWPADRQVYERLAVEFKSAESDGAKRRVLERLEQDQKSDNALIRYYAVSTMIKLDPQFFAPAIRLATQDQDATVRKAALRALQRD